MSAVPAGLTLFYQYNPLGAVIEAVRAAAFGLPVPWSAWATALTAGVAAAILGHAFFQHSRDEFADAL
mgnify:FL=1